MNIIIIVIAAFWRVSEASAASQVNDAKNVVNRSRRDLVAYNRQQNNVLKHLRLKSQETPNSDYIKQLIRFYNLKRNGTYARKIADSVQSTTRNKASKRQHRFSRFHKRD